MFANTCEFVLRVLYGVILIIKEAKNSYMSLSSFAHVGLMYMAQNMYGIFTV